MPNSNPAQQIAVLTVREVRIVPCYWASVNRCRRPLPTTSANMGARKWWEMWVHPFPEGVPHEAAVTTLLVGIPPGALPQTPVILAEIGSDISRYPTPPHRGIAGGHVPRETRSRLAKHSPGSGSVAARSSCALLSAKTARRGGPRRPNSRPPRPASVAVADRAAGVIGHSKLVIAAPPTHWRPLEGSSRRRYFDCTTRFATAMDAPG